MFTQEQLNQLKEVANENEKNTVYWKYVDGSKKLLSEATKEELQQWKEHCESMLYSTNPKKLGKVNIYDQLEEQKNLCNAEIFMRTLISDERLELSKFSLGNIFINFIAANLHIEDIEKKPISLMFDKLDPTFNTVTIENGRNACLNQLGVFKRFFTNKFIYGLGIWITTKDTKDLNLPKKATPREKLEALKTACGIPLNTFLRLNPNGLSLNEFKLALNIKNKNYSALTTNELVLLRDKLLNNYQLTLVKQITMWKNLLKNIEFFLNKIENE